MKGNKRKNTNSIDNQRKITGFLIKNQKFNNSRKQISLKTSKLLRIFKISNYLTSLKSKYNRRQLAHNKYNKFKKFKKKINIRLQKSQKEVQKKRKILVMLSVNRSHTFKNGKIKDIIELDELKRMEKWKLAFADYVKNTEYPTVGVLLQPCQRKV